MKSKLAAIILSLGFAAVSHAGQVTISTTLPANQIFPNTTDTAQPQAGSNDSNATITLPFGVNTPVTLYTLLFALGGTNGTGSVAETTTLTVAGAAPGTGTITDTITDTVTGVGASRNHAFSDVTSGVLIFSLAGGTQKLTVTPIAMTAFNGTGSSGNTGLQTIQATFRLDAPEPGTWVLLSTSLLGLGLFRRRNLRIRG